MLSNAIDLLMKCYPRTRRYENEQKGLHRSSTTSSSKCRRVVKTHEPWPSTVLSPVAATGHDSVQVAARLQSTGARQDPITKVSLINILRAEEIDLRVPTIAFRTVLHPSVMKALSETELDARFFSQLRIRHAGPLQASTIGVRVEQALLRYELSNLRLVHRRNVLHALVETDDAGSAADLSTGARTALRAGAVVGSGGLCKKCVSA